MWMMFGKYANIGKDNCPYYDILDYIFKGYIYEERH